MTLLDDEFFEKLDKKSAAIKVLQFLFVTANRGAPELYQTSIMKLFLQNTP